ncbi:SMC-Scp complex subunit ScpB [Candidatus Falkowbacteria bacterium RIFOXYD2_FULL_35_9]|uniref:SMC-Scp complex subunit ScpB n=1 Tax=Candidatus Falkowbacteria bacterium RIFOXYC2_FULL_36_12 TaxID=1798002 RepID=A0A1F5SZ33_9BACT|nr:MAG: SMC-Scp complex subunit ScpB [Candidatus Falkowbacteria bacterium RIFOXYC2_FULL_36_12]OGF34007.1 MAG: SMC-Scp complex subunit ScpB [Candidatus Falkowbacteria bacterium RIFOXYA2_FULL_35_8]OGF46105.1 MAG: SMC-Scp complex subunit ScpB [Candidatus Falkowbacteria bacterium RIFOXYD2_FULL_35_9]
MLRSQIESLLFASIKPLASRSIFNVLKKSQPELKFETVEQELKNLFVEYSESSRGIVLIESEGQYQFTTSADNSDLIKQFLKDDRSGELTQPSLETLTIIAYRGPVSKPVIEQIRGVNCSLILRNLLIRGLVQADGEEPELFFSVTPEFLKYLGIVSVKELPDYEKLHVVENLEQFLDNRQAEEVQELKK